MTAEPTQHLRVIPLPFFLSLLITNKIFPFWSNSHVPFKSPVWFDNVCLFGLGSARLCLTQIRNSAGQLITLRNGTITSVANASRDWARMDFTLWVDHDTDIKQALDTIVDVFHDLQASLDWVAKLIGQPDILGIDRIDPQGILLKIRAQTAPGQQFSVTREYRWRLNQALKAKGIQPAIPQRELRYHSSSRSSSTPLA